MTFEGLTRYRTGVLVPVAALRSDGNLGIGEFADLPELARWCADIGLDTIQLLPVNDSGGESSPYSALSAFALHPVYLRISDLPEMNLLTGTDRELVTDELARIRENHAADERIRYRDILREKLAVIRTIFDAVSLQTDTESAMAAFANDNPWIKPYTVFKHLKRANDERSWLDWSTLRDPTSEEIDAAWSDPALVSDIRFDTWLQLRLHEQFSHAAQQVAESGVVLKGDLPILMNDDSVDVWAHRDQFSLGLRAGAPPDMFSQLGQNWGLPIYNWDAMATNGYRWWKERLLHCSRYYSAYRIDHVLGFFRVWAIPAENSSGLLGRFVPSQNVSRDRLARAGFDEGRITWLAEPHLSGNELRLTFKADTDSVIAAALEQIGNEDLYRFAHSIRGERDVHSLDLPDDTREWLVGRYADRALVRISDDEFAPAWSFRSCSRYQQLTDAEKAQFEDLVTELGRLSETIWERQARTLLGFMREATDMLPCAEDLGVIPRVVPEVLRDLEMLGLRIPRWSRLWDKPGQPFVPLSSYPFLTVCAPSVHDTSTVRGWWQEGDAVQAFWECLGLPGDAPDEYSSETARTVMEAILETSSALCILQIQDILALSDRVEVLSPESERVNVPGTVNDFNWNYRMPVTLRELAKLNDLKSVLGPAVLNRSARPVPDNGNGGGSP